MLRTITFIIFFGLGTNMALDNVALYKQREEIIWLSESYLLSRCLHVATQLSLIDHLAEEAQTAHELASKLNLDSQSLYRLLRMLASHGLLYEGADKKYSVTPKGLLLTANHPNSVKDYIAGHDELWWDAIRNLEDSIKDGECAFIKQHGKTFWDVLETSPTHSERFNKAMACYSDQEDLIIAQAFNFGQFTSIIDVGGGNGGLVQAIQLHHSNIKNVTLFDLPEVIENTNLPSTILVRPGDFFQEIPSGAEAYIMKWILSDWSDEECVAILKNCKKALGKTGKLIIIDDIILNPNEPNIAIDFDILMMVLTTGKMRNEQNFTTLFNQAGLTIESIVKLPTGSFAIIVK